MPRLREETDEDRDFYRWYGEWAPRLDPAARARLLASLELVHPGHRWLAALQTGIPEAPPPSK